MIIKIYHFEAPHGEEVCHHGAEAGGEAGLGDEAKLELGQADHVVTLLPVPRGDVQQVRLQGEGQEWNVVTASPSDLVVVLHQLDDDPALGAVVLHGDHPHDVGSVLRVGVRTVLDK